MTDVTKSRPAPATREVRRPIPFKAWAGQALLYALFALVIGTFSRWPSVHPLAADEALIKLSFSHTGQPVGDCRTLTAAELEKLPPNMRAPVRCPRERSPVTVELDVGGATVYRRVAAPSGLSRDGASSVYQRLTVPAGEQQIAVRLNDDTRKDGPTHQRQATVTLAPAQVLVIDFDADQGEITFR
jgi:hypothetical protein